MRSGRLHGVDPDAVLRSMSAFHRKPKPLIVRDEIHGDIAFDQTLRLAIDHEYFQRLRSIRQLGLAEYVFPCANHSRFQHSLGASYLASVYFKSLVRTWMTSPLEFEGKVGETKFYSQKTFELVHAVSTHTASHEFWGQVTALAALLHDIGHGPWSHTFEMLDLDQDYSKETSKLKGAVAKYFSKIKTIKHEDVSVLYIRRILDDIETRFGLQDAQKFFLPVATLVHRKMFKGEFGKEMRAELEADLKKRGMAGGVDFHSLLAPLISGPFDVDRMDYIQRDGRNCGVHIGGIEWRRIVGKLVPCLASHPNDTGEPENVVLVSGIKNQHVLDDFIFSLFQMYAQVYLHPKIVGLEESIRRTIEAKRKGKKRVPIDFDKHASFSDDKFRTFLAEDLGVPEVNSFLLRQQGAQFRVTSHAADYGMEDELIKSGYSLIDTLDRPMMKDSVGVFLSSHVTGADGTQRQVLAPWTHVSPVAKQFYSINYSPKIWIRSVDNVL